MKYNGIYLYGHMHNEESFVHFYILDANTLSLRKHFSESSSKSMSSYYKAFSTLSPMTEVK